MQHQELVECLANLKLTAMGREFVALATLAQKENRTYEQYLSMLANVELEHRQEARLRRLLAKAQLPFVKEMESYNFSRIKGITAREAMDLASGSFVAKAQNIVLYGGLGVGKTHLAVGLIKKLCEKGIPCLFTSTVRLIETLQEAQKSLKLAALWKRLDIYGLIVCDELGYLPQTKEGADLFFQFISQRYERKSILITTNLVFSDWDQVFLNKTTTAAAVDRIIHSCQTFNIEGPSWRQSEAKKNVKAQE